MALYLFSRPKLKRCQIRCSQSSSQRSRPAKTQQQKLQRYLKGLNRSQLIAAIADTPIEKPTALSQERIRRLDESSLTAATTDAEAAYLAMWRRKCERLGRVNYPPGNIQGELVMRVSIASSGQLNYVRIVRSSGSTLLDEAALKTVRQAAPYQPFSVEMRKAYDQLEFTRTWQYSKYGTGINR